MMMLAMKWEWNILLRGSYTRVGDGRESPPLDSGRIAATDAVLTKDRSHHYNLQQLIVQHGDEKLGQTIVVDVA